MDLKLINPFIDATLNVLETIASVKAEAGKPYLKKDQVARGDVSGVIGLTGEANGTLSVSFSEETILAIASDMFGEEMNELNEEIGDAVGEIANIISGQARKTLEELGTSLKAAVPSVVIGRSHTIKHISTHPVIAVPFNTDNGEFTIEVCFEK